MPAGGATATALSMAGIKKRFGAFEALRGVDLKVRAGCLFGLIGPNGAGKTTAFSIACGFLRPDEGQLRILDGDGFHAARCKGRVSAMPQDAALGREIRCRELLIFLGMLQGLTAQKAEREAAQALDELGLADKAEERTRALSHGMLRRLAVAQALIGSPELVLLDEPTSGLDPRHAHELRELLAKRSRRGQTLIISSHNLVELESLCDEVAFIDRGVVVTAGTTDVVTGKGQEIEVLLAEGPEPLDALRVALPGDTVAWEAEARVLRIRYVPSLPEGRGRQPEEVIGVALRVLLDGGARISGVRRGTSLEKKFLEMV